MAITYFPAILHPADQNGLWGVEVPGINVNGSGATLEAALNDATSILQEVVDDLSTTEDGVPVPAPADSVDANGGTLVMIPASVASKSVRINVTLPDSLIERIDAVTPNRSSFLAEGALMKLRDG
jgi:predicted RNase H-like HicB family nuclease